MTKTRHLAQHDFFPGRVFRAMALCCSGEPIVPLGLIGSHWGGTMVRSAAPQNSFRRIQHLRIFSSHAWHESEFLAAASSHPATCTSQVEMWQPNATLNAQVCKNDTGGPWAPWQLKRWDIAGGALYNGMVLPYVNM